MKTKRFLVFGLPAAALLALGLTLAGCESPTGGERGGGGAPATPTGVQATAQSSSRIGVSWDSVSKADDYSIYRASSSGGYYSYLTSTGSSPYTDANLSPNTTYYYKVSAGNAYGESAQSSYASAKTLAPGEDLPTGDLSTSWTESQWESWFNSHSHTDLDALTALELFGYANYSWIENNPWWYELVADWNSGDSGSEKPAVPTGVTAQAHSPTSISVSWNYVSGANGYRVYRSNSSNGYYSEIDWTYETSYTDTGLSPNTTYYYKVSAYNSAGDGAQSYYVYATTRPPEEGKGEAPAAPTGLTIAVQSSNSISVGWDYVSGADSYRVYRSDNGPYGYYFPHDTAYNTYYTDTGLSSNTTYYYKVSAYSNSTGEGEQSYSVSAATAIDTLATPTNVTAVAQSSNSISVSWSYVSDASTYRVYRADSSGNYGPYFELVAASGTSYTDTGLSPGTTYSYRVSAYNNSGGESERSSPVSATTLLPASGTLTITVGFNLGAITITGSNGTNTIRQTGSPQTLTLRAEGYTGVVWYVDGDTFSHSDEITIYASDYTTKLHSVTFTGSKSETPYAQAIPFTVLY